MNKSVAGFIGQTNGAPRCPPVARSPSPRAGRLNWSSIRNTASSSVAAHQGGSDLSRHATLLVAVHSWGDGDTLRTRLTGASIAYTMKFTDFMPANENATEQTNCNAHSSSVKLDAAKVEYTP